MCHLGSAHIDQHCLRPSRRFGVVHHLYREMMALGGALRFEAPRALTGFQSGALSF